MPEAPVAEIPEVLAAEDNTLVCLITGKSFKATDKEQTLQSIIRSLSSEYGFSVSDMERDFKLNYVDPDSNKNRKLTLSIAIFEEGQLHEPQNMIRAGIVEGEKTKSSDKKKGILLLQDILGALLALHEDDAFQAFGLWTNGSELHYMQQYYDGHDPDPVIEELADIPGKGETLEDLDRADRQMLRVAAGDSLLNTFRRCHDYIYGNQGKIKTAFWELLNIIFCKIYDERRKEMCWETGESYRRKFWVGVKERNNKSGQIRIAKRIKDLFEDVKTHPDYKDVFDGPEQISLNDQVLSYIAGEVSRYSFLDSSVDVKGMAYESIVSNTLKQERGQFFTPRNIVRLMVEMMNPTEQDVILDPACGSGGFLVMALDHVRQNIAHEIYPDETGVFLIDRANSDPKVMKRAKEYARTKIFGVDFDSDLRKAARMNMVMSGDGHGNIFTFNSLRYPQGSDEDMIAAKHKKLLCSSKGGSVDIIFTNPPFGAKIPIDDQEILQQYDLGYRWKKDQNGKWQKQSELQSSQPPEILFIERCFQFLKPEGRMAIVLPDGILGNPDLEYVRAWILQHAQVLASIDLPVEAFLPQVGVQASLLFLKRKTEKELLSASQQDYEVFMAIAEKIGKDRRGKPIYIRDEDGAELVNKRVLNELVRYLDGTREIKQLLIYDKEVDDDLPKIGERWKAFLLGEDF
jgi:type I restriction enzyme M protein